ncbi:MAG TPA: class I adenylate-forming enzyme family protein [Candidatus Limnocylindrales bacterium]|nr:class I adenylate-forming enzyme family protein [Candidatus Limnocylindrales bacterium]
MARLHEFLKQYRALSPGKEAVVQEEYRLTYAQLDTLVDRLAGILQQNGIAPGDRICLLLDNSPDFVIAYLAILQVGGVVVPLNPSTTLEALTHTLEDCSPKALFLEKRIHSYAGDLISLGFGDPITLGEGEVEIFFLSSYSRPFGVSHPHPPVTPSAKLYPGAYALNSSGMQRNIEGREKDIEDDLAAIIYTSGTTGQPKGVMLTHGNLEVIAETGKEFLKLTSRDRMGILVPLFHLYGLREIDGCLRAGGTLILAKNLTYPAQVLKQFHGEQVTGFSGVPGGLTLFMDRYESLLKRCQRHLRYITLGTSPAPPSLLTQLKTALPTTRLFVTYGLTEVSRVCFREVTEPDRKAGSVGQPYPGVTLSILDEQGQPLGVNKPGRVAVKSSMIMKGYWNRPDLTQQCLWSDGTLLTPDYGYLDSENYLFLLGRTDELINSGGEKISPEEIEAVLRKHPAVREAAVTGIPDPAGILGEVVKAWVVCDPKFTPDPHELMGYCARYLESFKVPKVIEFSDSLPKTVLGKTQRSLLK